MGGKQIFGVLVSAWVSTAAAALFVVAALILDGHGWLSSEAIGLFSLNSTEAVGIIVALVAGCLVLLAGLMLVNYLGCRDPDS